MSPDHCESQVTGKGEGLIKDPLREMLVACIGVSAIPQG